MQPASSHRGGSGEPLVLIHGYTATWRNWRPVLPALEARHDVLAVGLAGHYGCPPLADGAEPSIAALADAIERDMDAAGFEEAHVAGNSLGGFLALELGARGRARSVVALSPAGGWEEGTRYARRIVRLFARQLRTGRAALPHLEKLTARPRLRRLALRDVVLHGERVPPSEAVAMVEGSVGCPIRQPLMDALMTPGAWELAPARCPTLVAWAEHDRILPERHYTARFRALLPDAEWRVLPDVGHLAMYDDPELVATTIIEFAAAASERERATAAAAPAAAQPAS
jgi:pimeloyl-ACP methyl ester carboxylesterase